MPYTANITHKAKNINSHGPRQPLSGLWACETQMCQVRLETNVPRTSRY